MCGYDVTMSEAEDKRKRGHGTEPEDQETYDLVMPEDDEPGRGGGVDLSSGVGGEVDIDDSGIPEPVVPVSDSVGGGEGGTKPKVSEAVYKPQGDPEYVDPEVARMRREDQRKAAAMQAALEDAAKRKRNLLIAVVVGVLVVIGVVVWQVT